MSSSKAFPSKVLLIGEYVVTLDSPALAIPFFGKSGSWSMVPGHQDETLARFATYLSTNDTAGWLDVPAFSRDIDAGLKFVSSIPEGYGLGSSGALVAAVYDQYATAKTTDLNELKEMFSALESFFHGKSSGIDPLVSYLREPLLSAGSSGVQTIHMPHLYDIQIFLIDSFQKRNTDDNVQRFREKKASNPLFNDVLDFLTEQNRLAIDAFLQQDSASLWKNLKEISRLQFNHFQEFIPPGHETIWENSLLKDDFAIKLCGAGGGGYSLGFTKNMATVMPAISKFAPLWVS